jgi:hypothetical protein
MRSRLFDRALAAVIAAVFVASGLYAINGPILQSAAPLWRTERPAWVADVVSPGHFPVFLVRPDGSALPIGRALEEVGSLELKLFPDLLPPDPDRLVVHILPTDLKSIWTMVPFDAKVDVGKRAEQLARKIQSRVLSIAAKPEFGRVYLERFRRIAGDAYAATWTDPRIELVHSSTGDLIQPEDARAFVDAVMPVVIPAMRGALMEMLLPHWEHVKAIVLEGRLDLEPFARAAKAVLADKRVRDAIIKSTSDLAASPRTWRLGSLLVDVYIDLLVRDPRFEKLTTELLRDPSFADDIRAIEVEISSFATSMFKHVAERGDRGIPDTLALRMIRYVLLNRLSAVAVLLPPDDPQAEALAYYRVARVTGR